jgi:hypothetical protein
MKEMFYGTQAEVTEDEEMPAELGKMPREKDPMSLQQNAVGHSKSRASTIKYFSFTRILGIMIGWIKHQQITDCKEASRTFERACIGHVGNLSSCMTFLVV